jgi:glutamate N-acetyltransferase/amino-acid N-acetyltransferase
MTIPDREAVAVTVGQVNGFRASGAAGGLRKQGGLDVALVTSDRPCVGAGVFTRNRVKAAPVLLNMRRLEENPAGIRAVVANAGNANAATGQQGMAYAEATAAFVAEKLGCAPEDVLVLSTGVIGQQLNMEALKRGIEGTLDAAPDWEAAARAIMTTDTRPKLASVSVETPTGNYTIAGIAKGAGMIAPNMATMLGVIVTDAVLTPQQAQAGLQAANAISFNRIVVDGDMSTNDTVLLLANGASEVTLSNETDEMNFRLALSQLCIHLAKALVRDGEGATKFVTLLVTGAPDDASAQTIANTIARSPLVKTAFYGSDANWGRILAATGYAGVPIDPENMRVSIQSGEQPDGNGYVLYDRGVPHSDEVQAAAIMQSPSICVTVDCGVGHGEALVWTCDLSHDYISINADYRT